MTRVFAVLTAAVLAAGCGGGEETVPGAGDKGRVPPIPLRVPGEPDTARPYEPPAPDSGDDGAAPAAGGAAGSAAVERAGVWTAGVVEGGGGWENPPAVVRRVEAARHEGFDRVVFEFEGEVPAYHVAYVDRPVRECGSGFAVELPLSRRGQPLLVKFEPARAHTEEGRPTLPGERYRELRLGVLEELVRICDFEGQVAWVLGVSSPNRFRVLELREPGRVVVDVRY